MASWWEYIPIVSTLGHAAQEVFSSGPVCKGMEFPDYIMCAVNPSHCSEDSPAANAALIQQCVTCVSGVWLPTYISDCVGSTAAPVTNQTANMVLGAGATAVSVKAFAAGGTYLGLTGPQGAIIAAVLVIDGFIDAAILQSRLDRLRKAAQAAINNYCKC